jgi:ribokinase
VTGPASAEEAGRWFIDRGVAAAIITLGEHGSVLVTADGAQHFYPPKVKPVDTTGAGDTFAGAFLTELAAGRPAAEAIAFASHAAAISVTRPGVVDAIPTRDQVEQSMQEAGAACAP